MITMRLIEQPHGFEERVLAGVLGTGSLGWAESHLSKAGMTINGYCGRRCVSLWVWPLR